MPLASGVNFGCAFEARVREARKLLGTIGKTSDRSSQPGEHGPVEVAERSVLLVDKVTARRDCAAASPRKH